MLRVAAKTEVPITGSVLAWARSEAGYTVDEFAGKIGVEPETVKLWEQGDERPGRTEFGKIINAVRRPSAIFYMPAPPIKSALPTAFRQAVGTKEKKVSPSALREIRKARRIQRVLGWLIKKEEKSFIAKLPKVDWHTVTPVEAGVQLRKTIGLSLREQCDWKDIPSALHEWRNIFDDMGVFVFSLQLGKKEIRGFSAWDEYAPLVAVNTAYTPAARIFTLGHELAHIVTQTDSACLNWVRPNNSVNAERWCEQFAAAFLLPPNELKTYLRQEFNISENRPVVTYELTRRISSKLKISARATALALMDANLAPSSLYGIVEREANSIDYPPVKPGCAGQKIVPKRIGEYGIRVSRALVEATEKGSIGSRDIADYLGMTLNDLEDLKGALRNPSGAKE